VTSAFVVDHLRVERGGVVILPDISFSLAPGELVGLLGPSGSGKTSLMRALLGVQRVSAGSATAWGLPVGSAPLRRRVGYMAQSSAIYPDLTVVENLRYFAGVLGIDHGDVARALAMVDLVGFERRLVGSLSGGEKARVSLAVATLGAPDILLLDEPTVGLDPLLRRDLWRTFADLAASGVAMVVSSHVMDEAARCQRLLLLRGGSLLFDDTPAQLLSTTGAATYDQAFIDLLEAAPC
jgi:ABC-2 type transport system ATP-binding protein